MLRVINSQSAGAAKSYYANGLSKADYYIEGQELNGPWNGKAASLLGLIGEVKKEDFFALCDGKNPMDGRKLTQRLDADRRPGFDFEFSCPKSVSLLYSLGGDERILTTFRSAVAATMTDMEKAAQTRVRRGKANSSRTTGNLVWSEHVHFTARPVNGVPDPQLHAHCYVFNATFDQVEGRWKAVENGAMKTNAPYYEALFVSRLASGLAKLGYPVEARGKFFEIAGFSEDTIGRFSSRRNSIEALAKERGVTSSKVKHEIGLELREAKQRSLTDSELKAEWTSRLTKVEKELISTLSNTASADRSPEPDRQPAQSAKLAVERAIEHTFERSSVVSERELETAALRFGVGSTSVEEIHAAMREANLISGRVGDEVFCTTGAVLAEESRVLEFARDGRGQCSALAAPGWEFRAEHLRDEEKGREGRAAVTHVISSKDSMITLLGAAGTGKTTVMKEIKSAIEANGRELYAFAPTTEASRGVQRTEGFTNADTVARLLADSTLQEKIRGQVVWIDEAGLVGAKSMRAVVDLCDAKGARLLLSGDTRQHTPVERGDILRTIVERAGIEPAHLTEIRRQKDPAYREVARLFSEGRGVDAIKRLDRLGEIRQVQSEHVPRAVAKDYLSAVDAGKTVVVVAPTRAEGERVNNAVREGLRARGIIQGEDREVLRLRARDDTTAVRRDASIYRQGQVVEFHQAAPGFKKGGRYSVDDRAPDGAVRIRDSQGKIATLPLEHAERFRVYETERMPVAAGDTISFTKNGYYADGKKRFNNGQRVRVKSIDASGHLCLENGAKLSPDAGHVAPGHCFTSYKAQGKTVDRVLIAQSSDSGRAASMEQLYVSASRNRETVTFYTDDKKALYRAAERTSARLSATALAERAGQHRGNDQFQSHRLRVLELERSRAAARSNHQRQSITHERN